MEEVLAGREEVNCPLCSRPIAGHYEADGRAVFDGCTRKCVPMYWVPEESIIFGPVGGAWTVWRKKWLPSEPEPTMISKYTNGAW
jgi:hypothetical protein